MNKQQPVVLVLAAGRGQRFRGRGHKLTQALQGSTVLGTTLRNAQGTGLRVMAVCSREVAGVARQHLGQGDVIVLPERNEAGAALPWGLGHSIAAGVTASGDAAGWLIWPGDMPFVQSKTGLAVAEAMQNYPIAFAQYKWQRGHPVGFNAELVSELMGLTGDEGAKRLLSRYPAQGVELDDAGILQDVDTVEDLDRLRGEAEAD